MTRPSGEQHELAAGGYTAVVTQVGASLRLLRSGNRDLVVPWPADAVRPLFRGALLAPWPNRVRDGAYSFGGVEHQLPITEVPRRTAIHGLVTWQPWDHVGSAGSWVELGTRLWAQDGYPFTLDLRCRYELGDGGLTTSLTARNAGTEPAPYGCGAHPYLVGGAGRVDDWTLELPAAEVLAVDGERLLPGDPPVTERVETSRHGAGRDLSGPTSLAGLELDHAFTGLADGTASVRLRGPDGHGAEVTWPSAVLPWVQVHTADRPEPEMDRVGLAVEPMTCPPDALRSGRDVVALAAGEEHRAQWTIRYLP